MTAFDAGRNAQNSANQDRGGHKSTLTEPSQWSAHKWAYEDTPPPVGKMKIGTHTFVG